MTFSGHDDSTINIVLGLLLLLHVLRAAEGYVLKTRKMLFLDLAPPMLQNSGFFYDSTRPHLHFDGFPPKSWRSVVSVGPGALQVYYKKNIG